MGLRSGRRAGRGTNRSSNVETSYGSQLDSIKLFVELSFDVALLKEEIKQLNSSSNVTDYFYNSHEELVKLIIMQIPFHKSWKTLTRFQGHTI